jgi:hypothetical protein
MGEEDRKQTKKNFDLAPEELVGQTELEKLFRICWVISSQSKQK